MPTLNNIANSSGTFAGLAASLSSNAVATELTEDLVFTKAASLPLWINGNLTYTLTLTNNSATEDYTGVTFSDVLDTTQVDFVTGSVTLDGSALAATDYSYTAATGTLSIAPATALTVAAGESAVVTFQVQKV